MIFPERDYFGSFTVENVALALSQRKICEKTTGDYDIRVESECILSLSSTHKIQKTQLKLKNRAAMNVEIM
jgi:hypothetical protein